MKPKQSDLKASADAFAVRLALWMSGEADRRASLQAALRALIVQVRVWLMMFATHVPLPPAPAPRAVKTQMPTQRTKRNETSPRLKSPPRFGFSLIAPVRREPQSANTPRVATSTPRTKTGDDTAAITLCERFDALRQVIANPRPAVEALRRKLARAQLRLESQIKHPPPTDNPSTDDIEPPPRLNRAQRRFAKAKARQNARAQRRDSG